MRRAAAGQVAVEMALVLGVVLAIGLSFGQLAGFGLTAVKVNHAAQVAAFTAASTDATPLGGETPCWAVTGGPQDPGAYRDAEICRTVVANVGNLDLNGLTISVSPERAADRAHHTVQVTVTYEAPITSPLLRWLLGATYTTTAEASSWSN
ncbi:MAG TPA: hypothetical protein VET82_11985 [Candidatus Eisenbacteria bacterium]|nr:hypothetical protein [Candidatus Eisenbacteria bacterium]